MQGVRGPRAAGWVTATIIFILLALFATLSYSAVLGESATADEPLHLVGGAIHRYLHDYRINFEDPPLLGWWASLATSPTSFNLDPKDPDFRDSIAGDSGIKFYMHAMYSHGVNHDAVLNRSRACFLFLGVLLGGLIAWWSYRLAGCVAAVAAMALYCFDPNFLAHAPLVKNDVPTSLLMCATCFSLWRFGVTGRWRWICSAILISVIATNMKFSGVLLFPMMALVLFGRCVLRWPMSVGTWKLDNWKKKTGFLLASGLATVCVFFIVTWGIYGFRFSATNVGKHLSVNRITVHASASQAELDSIQAGEGELPSYQVDAAGARVLAEGGLPAVLRNCSSLINSKLLPEGWMYGLLFTYAGTLARQTFLLGHIRHVGWWYYFPAAMLFKTPTATLALFFIVPAALGTLRLMNRTRERISDEQRTQRLWAAIAIGIPVLVYMYSAMTSGFNLGLRHVLPVYPFLYIAVATGFATLLRLWRWPMTIAGLLLFIGLATESIAAFPHYIPFFNFPSGGSSGGLQLLTDCNIDWGQDLPGLANWQKKHPDEKLYVTYFGPGDPASYGIRYVNLSDIEYYSPQGALGPDPGVVAISASVMQGVRLTPDSLVYYLQWLDPNSAHDLSQIANESERNEAASKAFRQLKPREVINGSIYLFDWPPKS